MAPDQDASARPYSIAAIASSAGGVTALSTLLSSLPAGFPAPVLVVQHLDPRHETVIADILRRRTALNVKLAEQHEKVQAGTVYVAPPDRHLLIGRYATLELTETELVHFVRPSADLLFESVAAYYGSRAVAVVLTGTGSDGAMGTQAVKARGGTVLVQDPKTAEFTGMPQAAVDTNSADFVLTLDEVGPVLARLFEPAET